MSAEEVLTKAIEKAIAGGWKGSHGIIPSYWSMEFYKNTTIQNLLELNSYYLVVFNHDFAKALWGEEITELWFDDDDLHDGQPLMGGTVSYPYNEGAAVGFETKAWRYHLQQMVIADNPIAYLKENI